MASTLIFVFFGLIMSGLAILANTRLRSEDRLPMQWWLDGEVTWSAPRHIALAFTPALALVIFATLSFLSSSMSPRTGQEDMVLPGFIGIGITFVLAQLFHFWLIQKTLRRSDRRG